MSQTAEMVDTRAAELAWQRVLWLQRAEVQGLGDPDLLDAAILAWRRAQPAEHTGRGVSHRKTPPFPVESPDERRARFARWLVEAASREAAPLAA